MSKREFTLYNVTQLKDSGNLSLQNEILSPKCKIDSILYCCMTPLLLNLEYACLVFLIFTTLVNIMFH